MVPTMDPLRQRAGMSTSGYTGKNDRECSSFPRHSRTRRRCSWGPPAAGLAQPDRLVSFSRSRFTRELQEGRRTMSKRKETKALARWDTHPAMRDRGR
jgi:hypothetical protein